MEPNHFETLELSQLEHVAGGGRIWNKIKHGAKKVGNALVDLVQHFANSGPTDQPPPGVG